MRCSRCQGWMTTDYFTDLLDDRGELDFRGWRCVNCGAVADPVILRHRAVGGFEPLKSTRRWRQYMTAYS